MSICIVIPSYNENENLNILLTEIFKIDLENVDVVIVDDSRESYKNQIDALNESYEKEEQRRAEADENYKNAVDKIQKDYLKDRRRLSSEEKKRLKELLEASAEDLDALIEQEFGFEKV